MRAAVISVMCEILHDKTQNAAKNSNHDITMSVTAAVLRKDRQASEQMRISGCGGSC